MLENILNTIDYVEGNINEKLGLERVASAVYYSKFHLHRVFAETVGLSLHSYIQRRQLTEAAKQLTYSARPIVDIALSTCYESQQSFSKAFKAMYKQTPQQFRRNGIFYPLQLRFQLDGHNILLENDALRADIRYADEGDIPGWMALVRMAVDGYPFYLEGEYMAALAQHIREKRALVMVQHRIITGVLLFSEHNINFFAVHPFYRMRGRAAKDFIHTVAADYLHVPELVTTTYRHGDKADTGYREFLFRIGFREGGFLEEYGYPTQRLILPNIQAA